MTIIEIRRQVAIVGQVTAAGSGERLGGAEVRLTNAPPGFVNRLVTIAKGMPISASTVTAAQAILADGGANDVMRLQAAQRILDFLQTQRLFTSRRVDRTQAAADGIFFFTDLPAGPYTLSATVAGAGTRYSVGQTNATVTSTNGDIPPTSADIVVPSTTLRGRITGPSLDGEEGSGPVPMAMIQVRGSGERTYSDAAGDYRLSAIEIGQRMLTITARGYRLQEQPATFAQAGDEQLINIVLNPSP